MRAIKNISSENKWPVTISCTPEGLLLQQETGTESRPVMFTDGMLLQDLFAASCREKLVNFLEQVTSFRWAELHAVQWLLNDLPVNLIAVYHGETITVLIQETAKDGNEEKLKELVQQLDNTRTGMENFAYTVSHDLREPVRMVRSFVELLVKKYGEELDGKAKQYIGFVIDGSIRLDQMIVDLLTYYRATRNLEPGDTDLPALLNELEHTRSAENIQVTIQPGSMLVPGSTEGYRRLFTAILDYAAVNRAGEQLVSISLTEKATAGNWEISINIGGLSPQPGTDKELFSIFIPRGLQKQGQSVLNPLALCRRVMEYMGGSICAEAEDECLTLILSLPGKIQAET